MWSGCVACEHIIIFSPFWRSNRSLFLLDCLFCFPPSFLPRLQIFLLRSNVEVSLIFIDDGTDNLPLLPDFQLCGTSFRSYIIVNTGERSTMSIMKISLFHTAAWFYAMGWPVAQAGIMMYQMPSDSPSETPSQAPSVSNMPSESAQPSLEPSISNEPSVSVQPSSGPTFRTCMIHKMGQTFVGATEIMDSIAAGTLNGLQFDPDTNTVTCHYCKGANFDGCNMVCKDPWSCWMANINNAISVECNGGRSCLRANIGGVDALECNGWRSCYKANIVFSGDVACSNQEACAYATFNSIMDEIICEDYRACAGIYVWEASKVECNQLLSCPHSKFLAVDSVECTDVRSCEYSAIQANSTALCTARQACYKAKTITANEIVCQGQKACAANYPMILVLDAGNDGTVTCGEAGETSIMYHEDCVDVKVIGTLSCEEEFSCGWILMGNTVVNECPIQLP